MQKTLSLQYLKEYIPEQDDQTYKHRPQCLYMPRPPARRKYETAIRPPDRNFFDLMIQRGVYLWIVAIKSMQKDIFDKIYECYGSVKALKGYQRLPICRSYEDCNYWVNLCPCQIVVFQDIFQQVFQRLSPNQNACGFHIISSDNIQIAKLARQNRKIRNIYDNQTFILKVVKQNMERLAITQEEKHIENTTIVGDQFKRLRVRNIIFPNFIKLSKHDKSEHNQYRLHLTGLRKLTTDDKLASKDKFVEFSKDKFPDDTELIQQYASNTFENTKEILRFYTLDSFFYRVLNNTLRIAKNTEEFFSIGEPFNKVFDAIKSEYDKTQKTQNLIVYRGADLTPSECQYLEENVGKYIEINGFISTSKSLQTAKNFARQRKNNTIFKIIFKKIPQKLQQYDYGYVDLQLNKCSAFDQDEVLINALNVFKISGKQKLQNLDLYILEYGAIFQILQKDPNKLSENDKFAYYSFKELKQMNSEVKDIGEVYLRTYQPEKAIEIYEFQLEKMKQSLVPVKKDQMDEVLVKAADAYLANGQPDKALKYYESTFISKKKKKLQKRHTLDSQFLTRKNQTELLQLSTKVTSIQNSMDHFERAEELYKQASKQIQKQLKGQWSCDILWSKIQIQQQVAEGKKSQMLFQEQYQMLKQIETTLNEFLKQIKPKKQPYEQKKIRLKLTQIYQTMAQATQYSQTQKIRISEISSEFDSVFLQLAPLVEKDSYEQGVINIRRSEILRRTKSFDQQGELRNYKRSISLIQKNSQETDQMLPKVYNNLADLQTKMQKKIEMSEAIGTYKKQLKLETIMFSENHPKPLMTKMNIAICERDDKNTSAALQEFASAFHTKIFKTQTKYTTHAKILFNMSQAYTDKGEDGLALKSLKQSYTILQKQLSKNDFEKSVLRFKIKLRIGRIYMSSSLRTPDTLKLAERNLKEYHKFITDFYKYKHSDVALSHNCLGALFSTVKNFHQSKLNFKISIQIYSDTLGTQSMEVGKITANLAICYAQLKKIAKATQSLLKSRQIFDKIYTDLRKGNPFQYESLFVQAEIQSLSGEYEKAIESCEQSKEAEKVFLESKRKNNSNTYINSEFLMRKNDSINTKFENTRPQVNSLFNPNINSINNFITEHGFKCDFQICECLIYLKNYKQAKKKLVKLRGQLIDRIQKEKINPLFKDTVHSKKQLYLKKSEQYIEKVSKAIQKKQKNPNDITYSIQSPMKRDDEIIQHLL